MATATIPVTVPAEAAARVEELGMQREFEIMLDFLKQNMPGLRSIVVEVDPTIDMWDAASVVLWTHRDDPGLEIDPGDQIWGSWFVNAFSPDVCRHFVHLSTYEAPHAR